MGFSYPLRTWWDFSQTLSTRTPETQTRQALTALGQKLITKTIHARCFFPAAKVVISLIKEQIMPLPLFQFNMTFEKDAVAGELGNK
jgi:hypothetical protein